MAWQVTPYSLPLALSAVVAFAVGVGLARRRRRPGATELSALHVALSGWALVSLLEISSVPISRKMTFSALLYGFVGATSVSWLAFAAAFTDRLTRDARVWVSLATLPVAVVAAALAYPATTLVWTDVRTEVVAGNVHLVVDRGPLFVVFFVFCYLLLTAGTALIARATLSSRTYRQQSALLLGALAVTWVTNVVYFFGLFPPGLDPTPMAFTVSGGLFALALLEFDLFDALPAAREAVRDHVIDDLRDGVVVVVDDEISDINPAAAAALGEPADAVTGRRLDAVAATLAARLDAGERSFEYAPEWCDAIYDVRVSSFSSVTGRIVGEVITLRDVTARRRREQRLSVMNRMLRHDLRNDLNVVSGYASLVADEHGDETDRRAAARKVVERVEEMLDTANKVRDVERALDSGSHPRERVDVGPMLRELVDRAETDSPGSTVVYDGPDAVPVVATPLVESVFDNLVENAIRHCDGDPTVRVAVELDANAVVTVEDDGPGIPEHELDAIRAGGETPLRHASGYGLWLVTWLVNQSGGRVTFDSDATGTRVRVTLPRATEADEGSEATA
ncbi:histidine kinase N-terminal 7TM domain-containing protein [Halogeometricum luteum]|uniref:histidine kinase n=1 Tax=Halogeometricum luteum TaxID=2950537 RepID=A0ABU2FYP1_9EURY|nr:histidine kinase N-terminal 7TM domain-containing protein [Halogeometricum sp. S3BR5-2]MDS0293194.1 ATP-binding protein [Halogeometricum sp. S3BR5-2]